MLVEFSLTWCSHHIQFMVFTFQEITLNLCIFTHASIPHSKLQAEFLKNLFPARRKRWRKLWFYLLKFNQKIQRWLGTLSYLYFLWFIIFLNVMSLQFCKQYLSNGVVLHLLTLLCNHGNLTLKFHPKKWLNFILMKGGFL